MNAIHDLICSSRWWSRRVEHRLVPWGVGGMELGDDVLEIGPGFGATTRLLASKLGSGRLTALELDGAYCSRLLLFKLIHIGDTLLPIEPSEMSQRLREAGLAEPVVDRANGTFRFQARKPTP